MINTYIKYLYSYIDIDIDIRYNIPIILIHLHIFSIYIDIIIDICKYICIRIRYCYRNHYHVDVRFIRAYYRNLYIHIVIV